MSKFATGAPVVIRRETLGTYMHHPVTCTGTPVGPVVGTQIARSLKGVTGTDDTCAPRADGTIDHQSDDVRVRGQHADPTADAG